MEPQIILKNLSVNYYTFNQGVNSFKDFITKMKFVRPFSKKQVLSNVNITIYPGEVVGIIGKNGTGKSSLLRCIAGIIKSNKGEVIVRGKMAPMLSIGSGIEMELTGIENIKLISSLLGATKRDIQEKIKEIIAFSELDIQTLNKQVKTYSTGMISRLSFSIAITQTPDILLIDEVLAVGDHGFQQKCLKRIQEIKESGCTILFVSHNADDIRRICTRAIFLDEGVVVLDDNVEKAIEMYHNLFNT